MAMFRNLKKLLRSLVSSAYHGVAVFIGKKNAEKIKRFIWVCLGRIPPKRTLNKDVFRLRQIAENTKSLKLHFGGDIRVLKGWINIDISPYKVSEDYPFSDLPELRGGRDDYFQIDFREGPLPLSDNSVDLIFHEDFIEHLTQKETIELLAETFRVLKPGGIHRINTPELLSSLKKNCRFSKGIAGINPEEWNRYGHQQILTKNFLEELARIIGYKEIIFNTRDNSKAKDIPKEYRPGEDRKEDEQIFCDLIK